jgi:transposase
LLRNRLPGNGRDLGQDQHGQDHRLGALRREARRLCALRAFIARQGIAQQCPERGRTQTFVAALRCDRIDAPWVIDGAMNRPFFKTCVETQLLPTLAPGDVVILDTLSSHKGPKVAEILRSVGARFLCLPPYPPDLNPIEMAISKIKAPVREAAARSCHTFWQTAGHVCELFTEAECMNYFIAAGDEPDQTGHALGSICNLWSQAVFPLRVSRICPH